jgi:hypothetical protein
MVKVHRRIEKLEDLLGISDRFPPFEHRISFVDSDGTVSSTLLLSESGSEWIHHEVPEGSGREPSEGA